VRILHVDTARTWRGGQNQVLLSVLGMAARGHDVRLACRRGGELERRAREMGVALDALPFAGDLEPRAAFGLRRLLKRHLPQVVQLHDPHAVSAGVLGSLGLATPLVATRRVDFRLQGPLSRRKYAACARVVAVSAAIAAVLRAGGLAPGALRVVHEGVRDRPALPGGRELLAAAGIPPDAPLVGNVAALTGHKDHETLLAAFARVSARRPDAWLAIVGDGELRAELQRRAAGLGLERCRFLGFRTDLDALLPAFDVFCLSSHMEGLGTSLLDAMCFARPVVATRAGGIPEAVADGETGLLGPPRDPDRLAANLLAVLADPALGARLGAAGRERFQRLFTTERMIDATLGVYGEVA
jgi:glycosyltransferase involved in cell wall biosynthesis